MENSVLERIVSFFYNDDKTTIQETRRWYQQEQSPKYGSELKVRVTSIELLKALSRTYETSKKL